MQFFVCSLLLLVNKTNNGPVIADDFKDVMAKGKRIKNIYNYMKYPTNNGEKGWYWHIAGCNDEEKEGGLFKCLVVK